jgi:hypothetical protein
MFIPVYRPPSYYSSRRPGTEPPQNQLSTGNRREYPAWYRRVTAKTFGSLKGSDVLATMAIYDQYNTIGWFHFCLGRISKNWARAYLAYRPRTDNNGGAQWSSQLITCLWNFTRKMWEHHNHIVHGATAAEAASREITHLHEKIKAHYAAYNNNSAYVLPRHQYLFTQRDLQQRMSMSYMSCWLCSIEEAHKILSFQEQHLSESFPYSAKLKTLTLYPLRLLILPMNPQSQIMPSSQKKF